VRQGNDLQVIIMLNPVNDLVHPRTWLKHVWKICFRQLFSLLSDTQLRDDEEDEVFELFTEQEDASLDRYQSFSTALVE